MISKQELGGEAPPSLSTSGPRLYSAEELAHAAGGYMSTPFHASGISIDTRTLIPGDLFVALKTPTGDGHDHLADALTKGAAGALVHARHDLPDDAPLLVVGDTLAGLTALATYARQRFEGSVIAITGSVGKTTTKEMLRTILAATGSTHAAHASYNNHWGVPLTLARMPPDAATAIVEIGMNHPGEIAPLSCLTGPDIAVITAIEAAHIGHFENLEAIADEKAAILTGLLQGGTAVLPADSPYLERLRAQLPSGCKVATFGTSNIHKLQEAADGSDITAEIAGQSLRFRLNVPGRHMVLNALAALTAAAAIGADLKTAVEALANFTAITGRGVRRPLLGGTATLLDESYNASAASVRAALAVLALQPATRRIAVLGDMLELGAHSQQQHASLANAVCESADMLYACGPWMKFLYNELPATRRGIYAEDSAALAPHIAGAIEAGDVVLVKGSNGSRMRIIVDALEALVA